MYRRFDSFALSSSLMDRYFSWFSSRHPPSIGSILRPSWSGVRLSGSGERKVDIATLAASTEMRARFANPGTLAQTRPRLSAMASIVIHAKRVESGSHQTVDSVIDANNFVNVTLISTLFYSRKQYLQLSASFRSCQAPGASMSPCTAVSSAPTFASSNSRGCA